MLNRTSLDVNGHIMRYWLMKSEPGDVSIEIGRASCRERV